MTDPVVEESSVEDMKLEVPPPTLGERLKTLLSEFDNAPAVDLVNSWKDKFGDVYLSALNDDELFVFRSLNRKEHRQMNTSVAEGKIQAEDLELNVVEMCLLWKSIKDLDAKAGTVPSLFEQVMQNSNFLTPQVLSNLVTKL